MKIQAVERDVPFDAFFIEGAKLGEMLSPLVQLLATKIEKDFGVRTNIGFTADEVAAIAQLQRR